MTSVSFALVADTCVAVVHDGVVCNTTHALTAMAAKHQWHPSVAEMHGCRLPDDDPAVKVRQLSVTSRPDTSVTDGDAAVQHTAWKKRVNLVCRERWIVQKYREATVK